MKHNFYCKHTHLFYKIKESINFEYIKTYCLSKEVFDSIVINVSSITGNLNNITLTYHNTRQIRNHSNYNTKHKQIKSSVKESILNSLTS